MIAHDKRHFHPTAHRKERKNIILNGIGSLVEMHGLWTKLNERDRLTFFDALVRLQSLVGRCNFMDGVTGHLTAETGVRSPYAMVRQVMQGNAVPAPMFLGNRNNLITSTRKRLSQFFEGLGLFHCVQ